MSYLRDRLSPPLESVGEVEAWRKALLDAAELIRTKGLWKSGGEHGNGQRCAANAIGDFTGGNFHEAHERFAKYLGRGDSVTNIFKWNDEPERTADDVIRALTECARS